MEQNNNNYQNGQVNYPGIENMPDNPYTKYYHEYIVDPNKPVKRESKSKRVASIVLCVVSNMVMITFCTMWTVVVYQLLIGYRDEKVTVDSATAFSVMLFVYFMTSALALSIVAKVLNRKNIWPVINFILMAIILVAVLVASRILPGMVEDNIQDRNEIITEALNNDVEDLMKKYSFDTQDFDDNFQYRNGKDYDIWVYISSEASEKKISKLDEFLEDLYDMDSSREYEITFTVHPVYFEPDDNSRFVFLDTYEFQYETISPRPHWADIDDHLYIGEYTPRKIGHVPETVEKGQMLIVIR